MISSNNRAQTTVVSQGSNAIAHAAHFIRVTLASERNGAYQVEWVRSCDAGVERLKRQDGVTLHAIGADLALPDSNGIETFDRLFLAAPTTPIMVLCHAYTETVAKQAVQFGRRD